VLVTQKSFNSPVWFNLGVADTPQQASACFINSVDDTMESIMDLAQDRGHALQGRLRHGLQPVAHPLLAGEAGGRRHRLGPGLVHAGFDAFAGVIKSGGKTRRAAKMVILNVDHPDVIEFIRCKADEEKKAWALIEAGYDGGFNVPGGAYDSVFFQNANHSVRVTDEFMKAFEGREWQTRAVTTGEPLETLPGRDADAAMAEAAHVCGDPGIQYDTTINRWNPARPRGGSTRATRAPSTCSSTTRPATSPA
jgi:ribonucleoside-diphosphate reductase alpha chain